jgi:hypothetical protein
MRPADIEDTTWPVGPTGTTRIRIVRPQGATGTLPLLMYFHGGGWVLGDTVTHERLVRELAEGVNATVVFVDYVNSPEAKYPTQNEQAYASMLYAVEHAKELNVDASRLAIMGDSVGGNMSAVVTLLAKERGGPKIAYQVLFYPLVDYIGDNDSYRKYADGPWLTTKTMKWMFDLQGMDGTEPLPAYPLHATVEQLRGPARRADRHRRRHPAGRGRGVRGEAGAGRRARDHGALQRHDPRLRHAQPAGRHAGRPRRHRAGDRRAQDRPARLTPDVPRVAPACPAARRVGPPRLENRNMNAHIAQPLSRRDFSGPPRLPGWRPRSPRAARSALPSRPAASRTPTTDPYSSSDAPPPRSRSTCTASAAA